MQEAIVSFESILAKHTPSGYFGLRICSAGDFIVDHFYTNGKPEFASSVREVIQTREAFQSEDWSLVQKQIRNHSEFWWNSISDIFEQTLTSPPSSDTEDLLVPTYIVNAIKDFLFCKSVTNLFFVQQLESSLVVISVKIQHPPPISNVQQILSLVGFQWTSVFAKVLFFEHNNNTTTRKAHKQDTQNTQNTQHVR